MSPLRENIREDIEDFKSLGGTKILVQTTDISDYQDSIDMIKGLEKSFPDTLDFALGLHPSRFEEAMERNELEGLDIFKYAQKQIDIYEDFFNRHLKDITAIGECGLDYYGMYQYNQYAQKEREEIKEVQKRAFKKLCSLASKYNLPMSIHSRAMQKESSATKDALSILATEGKGSIRGSFHSYTGDTTMLKDILDMGMYVGFNAIITYPSGENVREILKSTPIERILFETDGPFLPTQSVRKNKKLTKRYGRPSLVKEIIETAAEIKGISAERLEKIADGNYITLFSK
jgi:TatD DNase family protein